jgi:hypothetical protein
MKTGRLRASALVLAATLAVAACGGSTSEIDVAADGTFAAPTLSGESFDLADYAGQDVMLWLWAPW